MTEQERKSYLGFGLILALVGGGYLLLGIPLPRVELMIWGVILAVWAVGYLRPAYKQWNPQLHTIYKAMLIFLLATAVVYFIVRAFAPVPVAMLVAIGLLIYFARFGLVEAILIINKRYDEAHRYVDTLLKIFPRSTRLYANKAQIYLAQQKLEETRSIATQAIDLIKAREGKKPQNTSQKALATSPLMVAYGARMTASIWLHDGATALHDAEVFVRLMPLEPNGYINRATALLYTKDFEASQADFEHALGLTLTSQQRAVAENNYGLLAYATKDYSAALEHYIKVTQLPLTPFERKEFLPLAYSNMISIHITQDNHQAAWQAARTSHKINPESMHARVAMATMHALDGEWEPAVGFWRELVTQDVRMLDRAYVKERFYHWTPQLAEVTDQILDRLQA